MRYFPLFVDMKDRSVLVVGDGETAAQKVRLVAKTPAAITLVGENPNAELVQRETDGRLTILRRGFEPGDLDGRHIVYAATGTAETDIYVASEAKARGLPVNVVDVQEHCSFLTPAIVDRAPLTVAIGTEGTAPVLARSIRRRLEAMLPERTGLLADWAGRLRTRISSEISDGVLRRRLWERLLNGPFGSSVLDGKEQAAETHLETEIANLKWENGANGRVALVGAGPGDPDLLTLKALQALEAADVLVVDRLVSDEVLDRARRDAKRIYVGKTPGGPATTQSEINRILVHEAAQGHFVVRLKGGDPMLFARATEEMAAVTRAGFPLEIIPGITAAQGAAAALHLPLTERGRGRSVSLLTGATADGHLDHDWRALAKGPETFAVYMGVRTASEIRTALLDAGMAADTPIVIAEKATRDEQRGIATNLDALVTTIKAEAVTGPAILFFRADWERSGLRRPDFVEDAMASAMPRTLPQTETQIELRAG